MITPAIAPSIAPDQGLVPVLHMLPEHFPRYLISMPITAPAITPITIYNATLIPITSLYE